MVLALIVLYATQLYLLVSETFWHILSHLETLWLETLWPETFWLETLWHIMSLFETLWSETFWPETFWGGFVFIYSLIGLFLTSCFVSCFPLNELSLYLPNNFKLVFITNVY